MHISNILLLLQCNRAPGIDLLSWLPVYTPKKSTLMCKGIFVRTSVQPYICMYVHTYVRTYVCTYVRTYVRMYVCMYVCTYVRKYIHMYLCPYVRMSISHLFSFVLLGQYTSDTKYFYKFQTPYKMTIWGADQRCPRPSNPPYAFPTLNQN